MSSAIDICGLTRRLGGKAVLRNLDLAVATGDAVALLGANGAGKTTLLRIVAGLDRPDAERAEALGSPLPADGPLRARIGYAAHEPALYSDLSGAENLAFHARLYGRDDADVDAALDTVAMTHARDRPVRELSRGMVQRLSLARALVHRPELLVLDEPSTALDESGRRAVADIARQARDRGATVFAATHDFEFAASIAERACVLARGRVEWVPDGDATDAGRLRDAYTRIVAGGA